MSTVAARRGYRGARLGAPFEMAWVDAEPSKKTWSDLAERRGCFGSFLGVLVALAIGIIGGAVSFIFVLLAWFFFGVVIMVFEHWFKHRGRSDDAPVPKRVRREAYIELAEGEYFFTLEVDGKVQIFQPWSKVETFARCDYWTTFVEGTESPWKAVVHAIAMYPALGEPWLISKTMEAEGVVMGRRGQLEAAFGKAMREKFFRALEVVPKPASPVPAAPEPGSPAPRSGDVPEAFD